MKIKLIAPARKPEWGESFWDLKTLCKLTGRKAGGAPLALPTLAALTPSDVEVVLTDENVEPIDFEEKVDLVGITGMTCVIPRSYEIADEFRKRGVPVVIGGIHVSMLPEEAIQHCDSVVIGEAEEIWAQVVQDAQKKNLQKLYRAPRFPDLSNALIPRWDLLKNDKYCYFTIQTGRGCPYDCEFCSVKVFNGREYRHKTIEMVVEEIKALHRIDPKQLIFFTDDNLLAVPKYILGLLERLKTLEIRSWWCQASVNRLKDDRILALMHDAGCRLVFVGFESMSQSSLDGMNKSPINRVEEYKEIVNKIHSHKISVLGSFVLGGDNDDESIFEKTATFIKETNTAFAMINLMTPLPGSNLYNKMREQNRILHKKWNLYDVGHLCFQPQNINPDKLLANYKTIIRNLYSYKAMVVRLSSLWKQGIFLSNSKTRLSRGRIIFTLRSLLNIHVCRVFFIIKGLWNSKKTSITSVLLALSFHDYSKRIMQSNPEKENNESI